MREGVLWPVLALGCTILFAGLLVKGWRTGTMELPSWGTNFSGRRLDQPVRFWTVTALLAFLSAVSALGAIGTLFFPDGVK